MVSVYPLSFKITFQSHSLVKLLSATVHSPINVPYGSTITAIANESNTMAKMLKIRPIVKIKLAQQYALQHQHPLARNSLLNSTCATYPMVVDFT